MLRSFPFKLTLAVFILSFVFTSLAPAASPAKSHSVLNDALEAALQSPGKVIDLAPYRDPAAAIEKNKAVDANTRLKIDKSFGKMPLLFEKNEGQTSSEVKYLSRGRGYNFYLTPTESVMVLSKAVEDETTATNVRKNIDPLNRLASIENPPKMERAVVHMQVVGANKKAVIKGEDKLASTSNYFLGNDQSKWRQGVANYKKVHYEEVYPGIDLVYYGNQRKLEYDFIVRPGANPNDIELSFKGADKVSLDDKGNLVLETKVGNVVQHAPVIYQTIDGKKQSIDGRYLLKDNNRVAFHINSYNPEYFLTIDPLIQFSTFLSGSNIGGMTVDSEGNVYLTGSANSTNFPTTIGAYDPSYNGGTGNGDVFVCKFNAALTTLIYASYIGGGRHEYGSAIAVDALGNVYITGSTGSTNFPSTSGAFDSTMNGGYEDTFILKMNPGGTNLEFSTYLGGGQRDIGYDLALDSAGNIYITGFTISLDFPVTVGAYDISPHSEKDAYVSKLNASGSNLVYSTYLGGNREDWGLGIAVDSSGNAFVAGETESGDFPTTPDAYDTSWNGGRQDIFVSKLNETGSSLIFSTFIGGGDYETCLDLALDPLGNSYVTGYTTGNRFPTTPGAIDTSFNGGQRDAIVSKLNADGSGLIYSTYIGGIDTDTGWSIAANHKGHAYITGDTWSTNFPTFGGTYSPNNKGLADIFVTALNASGTNFIYSSFIGGGGYEVAKEIVIDEETNIFISGSSGSVDYPVSHGAFDTNLENGEGKGIITKLAGNLPYQNNDFNGDSQSDILALNNSSVLGLVLIVNSALQEFGLHIQPDQVSGWTINTTGDFNGDKKVHLLLHNSNTGEIRVVLLDGIYNLLDGTNSPKDKGFFTLDPALGIELRGVGDFNGDGIDEVLLYHPISGFTALVYITGNSSSPFQAVTTIDVANNWTLKTTGHFNSDNKTDLLITNTVTGEGAVIEMDGSTASSPTPIFTLDPATGWTVEDTGDFTGNGSSDILILHTSGALGVLTMDGLVFQTLYVPGGLLPNWELVNVGNYDGINKSDFLFYDTATGDLISGIQDGTTITQYNPILNLGPASGWTYH